MPSRKSKAQLEAHTRWKSKSSTTSTAQSLQRAIAGLTDCLEALTVLAQRLEEAENPPALVKIAQMTQIVPQSETWFLDRINDGSWTEGVHYYNMASENAVRPTYLLDREEILKWVRTPAAERPLTS